MELKELIAIFNDVLNREGNEVINAETQFKDCEHWDECHTKRDVPKPLACVGIEGPVGYRLRILVPENKVIGISGTKRDLVGII